MLEKTAQEIANQAIIIGSIDDLNCAIFIKDSLRRRCEKNGDKENSVFINIAYLEGNQNQIPTRIDKIKFDSENEIKNSEIRNLLINKANHNCKTINKDREACNLTHYH